MSKLRSVNTHFWNDNYIIDLDPIEKLLFLYLLTNPNTNMLGVYELHIRKISFDTGIDKDMVLKIFDRFNDAGKASYVDGYVCLHNFTKHQSYNTNMKVSAVNTFNELPKSIKKQPFIESIVKALKPLPKGSEPIAKEERELERELEEESEKKPSKQVADVPSFSDVKKYFREKGYNDELAKTFFEYYNEPMQDRGGRVWKDQNGKTVKSWKQKALAVWMREDNKGKETEYKVIDGGTW